MDIGSVRWFDSPRMAIAFAKSTLKHLLVLLGCIHMMCGPQGALQMVAWASMLASYSLENGVSQGVTDTFSGERPCALCLKLAATDFGEDGSGDPLHSERRGLSITLVQEWQAARVALLSPPRGRELAMCAMRAPAVIAAMSRGAGGPDTPPPRVV